MLESTRAEVSSQCPWRVGMDVYAAQEAKKERVHDHHWQAHTTAFTWCLLCSSPADAFLLGHTTVRRVQQSIPVRRRVG